MASFQGLYRLIAAGVLSGTIGAADAGEFTPIGEGGRYEFTECVEPVPPTIDEKRQRRMRRAPRARASAFRAYNAYVDELNAYFECMQVEADKDVRAYFNAVEAAFEDRQTKGLAEAERLQRLLNARAPNPADAELEDTLLGGEDAPSAPSTAPLPASDAEPPAESQ